jgi:hypothetical protein
VSRTPYLDKSWEERQAMAADRWNGLDPEEKARERREQIDATRRAMGSAGIVMSRFDEGQTDEQIRTYLLDLKDGGQITTMPDIAALRRQWEGENRRARAHARTVEVRPGENFNPDGARLLDRVEAYLGRFVAYPSEHARIAHVLWTAHTHAMEAWESTPRMSFLSPEPGSGKTRALEVSEPLVPKPVQAVNVSPAYLFRKVGDEDGRPTILFDEIDTVFGPKAKENEEIRGLLNAGHRKGAVAGRCVVEGKKVKTEEIPAYCAVALAGLGNLPDTIMSRSVIIRMRRRSPNEKVEEWRRRIHAREGEELRDELALWATNTIGDVIDQWPEMPEGVRDRDADVWEPLLAIADAAGGAWPERARAAAVALINEAKAGGGASLGVKLLSDVRTAFGASDRITTKILLERLHAIDESPWGNMKGKPLDQIGLARRLSGYGIKPRQLWLAGAKERGYETADFVDAWQRYLPPPQPESER